MFGHVTCLDRCSVGPSGHLLRSTASWKSKQAWDAPTLSAGLRITDQHWRMVKPWTGWKLTKAKTWLCSRTQAKSRMDRAASKSKVLPRKPKWQKVCLVWVWLCAFFGFLHVVNTTNIVVVEEVGENTAAPETEPTKLSDQDTVQWLTDRLAHSVTDLSRARVDQTSSSTADKGRWV